MLLSSVFPETTVVPNNKTIIDYTDFAYLEHGDYIYVSYYNQIKNQSSLINNSQLYQTFDNTSDSTVIDEYGKTNGTITNRSFVAGVQGNASGGGSIASTVRNILIGSSGVTFTSFSLQIKRIDTSLYTNIFSSYNNACVLAVQNSANGNYLYTFEGSAYNTSYVISDNTNFYHICGTKSNNYLTLYVNGVKLSGSYLFSQNNIGYLGRVATLTGQEVSIVDKFRVFNVSLTDEYVKYLYVNSI